MQKISEQIISTLEGNQIYTNTRGSKDSFQYRLSIRPEQTCHSKLQEKPLFKRKKMAPKKPSAHHYGYGWYNEKQLEDYYNKIIGNFFNNVSIAKLTISLCLLHISLR